MFAGTKLPTSITQAQLLRPTAGDVTTTSVGQMRPHTGATSNYSMNDTR